MKTRTGLAVSIAALVASIALLSHLATRNNGRAEQRAANANTAANIEGTGQPHQGLQGVVDQLPVAAIATGKGSKAAVANERFRRAKDCFFSQRQLESTKSVLAQCESLYGNAETAEQYEMCSAESENRLRDIASLQKKLDSCDGSDGMNERYLQSLDVAAASGDPDAQICFIDSISQDSSLFRNADSRVRSYAHDAFLRGDWRIASFLESALLRGNMVISDQFGNDIATRYRMNRLLRKGAVGDYAALLDKLAESDMAARGPEGEALLNPAEIMIADKWANSVYQKYYASSPALQAQPVVCAASTT